MLSGSKMTVNKMDKRVELTDTVFTSWVSVCTSSFVCPVLQVQRLLEDKVLQAKWPCKKTYFLWPFWIASDSDKQLRVKIYTWPQRFLHMICRIFWIFFFFSFKGPFIYLLPTSEKTFRLHKGLLERTDLSKSALLILSLVLMSHPHKNAIWPFCFWYLLEITRFVIKYFKLE